jgi:MazG family protein
MARLRSEQGCPWDREQTRASLKAYLIEEAYEVLEAIDESSTDHLVEELGDLLFQVVFHCQIASEQGEFTIADVLDRLSQKMVRRHPHVFGDRTVTDARQALAQWERIKHAEAAGARKERSVLDGVPQTLPALLRARRLSEKAGRVGFDWADWRAAWTKVREEAAELEAALPDCDPKLVREELGDLLFSIVNVARLQGVDAEDCLREASDKFTRRFREMEAEMRAAGREVSEGSAEELNRVWEMVKTRERNGSPESGRAR